jgi:Arc/MetJ-type ribon-helix-helix transcriptional regulator
MRETTTFSVSLPLGMARQVKQAMKAEHRSRSELIREALHVYFSTRLISNEIPTVAEARAHRRGLAVHKRGDYMTLEAYLRWNGPSSSPLSPKMGLAPSQVSFSLTGPLETDNI